MQRRSEWLVPLTGVAFVVLLIVGFMIQGDTPSLGDDSARVIADYVKDHKTQLEISAAIQAISLAFMLFFFSYLRQMLGAALGERSIVPRVIFAGAIVFVAGAAFDATMLLTMAETVDDVRPVTTQTFAAIYENDYIPMGLGAMLFLLASGLAVVRTGALPKWLGWVALLLVVLAPTPIGFASFVGSGIWILIVSVLLAVRARKASDRPKQPAV